MNLKKIDHRLALFPEYLRYLIDFKLAMLQGGYTPEYIFNQYETTGYMFVMRHDCPRPMSFDQWLFVNKHEDLIEFIPFLLNCVR